VDGAEGKQHTAYAAISAMTSTLQPSVNRKETRMTPDELRKRAENMVYTGDADAFNQAADTIDELTAQSKDLMRVVELLVEAEQYVVNRKEWLASEPRKQATILAMQIIGGGQ